MTNERNATMSEITQALAACYTTAPSNWLRGVSRVNGRVRSIVHRAWQAAADPLEGKDLPFDVASAINRLRDVTSGTDPRGGTERDQMIGAMNEIASILARYVTKEAGDDIAASLERQDKFFRDNPPTPATD